MNCLEIQQAGPMVTVQDAGRKGWLHAGVSGSGPMDAPSFRIANALVGNSQHDAALEFAAVGGHFSVAQPTRCAVTGGDIDISIDGVKLYPWESFDLFPGQVLKIGACRQCVWGYLAVAGGFDVTPVLGSRSTHLRSGLGGYRGRKLQAGDQLPLSSQPPAAHRRLGLPWKRSSGPIRVIPGPQDDYFSEDVRGVFFSSSFTLSSSRDRMAQILEGPMISAERGHDIVSDGTCPGSIQVPSSGQPIVLMAERQTTGGYPKIATIASIDLPRLAQMPSRQHVRFTAISQAEAEELLIAQHKALQDVLTNLLEISKQNHVSGDKGR
ncbi:biotin-dependent carboxyltransferase family protein [Rhizobium sp.]|jgi:5-oxoprolinase (ATP-hydrolysing) subunit C|uniref:5-oxoprolinase subunit C family protein n=1 Tax=Rhizobium sp. TaxID=391 RepID=UPI000E988210|nr:allophanate hydrolase [Rhizobium sp.]